MQLMSSTSVFGIENDCVKLKLQEEQLSILRNKPEGGFLCREDLNKMSYGSKVTSLFVFRIYIDPR